MNLYWLRNDLRTHDNNVLNEALKDSLQGDESLVFVYTSSLSFSRASSHRRKFILESINDLYIQFLKMNQTIYFYDGSMISLLEKLKLFNLQPKKVYFSEESATEELTEQNHVVNFCKQEGISSYSSWQTPLVLENDLPFHIDDMPFVYTDFRKAIESQLCLRRPEQQHPDQLWPRSEDISNLEGFSSFDINKFKEIQNIEIPVHPGEQAGLRRVDEYFWKTQAVREYKETRNGLLNFNDSTKFSPWLSVGALSPRYIMHELLKFESQIEKNESTYWVFFELLWRDYFKYFSKKYGAQIFQIEGLSKTPTEGLSSKQDQELFNQWCLGLTDEPFVNANMSELNRTGWMSNRGRQNVASFLIHDLNLPWTWGASYFESQLIDYDPDVNWGNWLYLSGRGSDPRARKFNLKRQADMYDPLGEYQRKWSAP